MSEELKVYLDHHISRDDFLYKHSDDKMSQEHSQESFPFLRLKDLFGDKSMDQELRKPDFQRVTWAWTPYDCVSLLESFIYRQVIPSIIMWLSPEGRWYVLDGGHRISVILAWLRDDWGDKYVDTHDLDDELSRKIKDAADAVYSLLEERKIATFKDFKIAHETITNMSKELREYEEETNSEMAKRANFYRNVTTSMIYFRLQWVEGDFKTAEKSFLRINSSGSVLTEWEIKLVENRSSSLARIIMSLSNPTKTEQYWPVRASRKEDEVQMRLKVGRILDGINDLHKILFEPPHDISFSRVQQPILAEPNFEPHKKPAYLAELFTIIKGGKGQPAQTERLLKEDKLNSSLAIVSKGLQLLEESLEIFSHLTGPSLESLALVPALYFYSENGKYVRGMLYGMLYWLFIDNTEDDLIRKKMYFSAYRKAFEDVLIEKKKEIFYYFGRRGSGTESTLQVAEYLKKLLNLLKGHKGNIKYEAFVEDYYKQFGYMSLKATKPSIVSLPYNDLPNCAVCRGLVDPTGLVTNGRSEYTHPFCYTNKSTIERILRGEQITDFLPSIEQKQIERPIQLTLLNFE